MTFSHSKKQFDNLIKKKSNFIFYKKILKLNSDPIPSFINLVEKNKYSFLYESVEKGREKGRYSICGYDSLRTIQLTNDTLTLENNKVIKKIKYRGSPLKKIDTIIKNLKFIKNKNAIHFKEKIGNLNDTTISKAVIITSMAAGAIAPT